MAILLEIIKISISGILVLIATYILINRMFENAERKRYFEIKKETAKTLNPIRLNAYERLALLLERLKPDALILRVQVPGMTAHDLHMTLLTVIREEFDHNLTQQIYVSGNLWMMISGSKDHLVQFINTIAQQVPDDVPGLEFGKMIIQSYANIENDVTPIEAALEGLKREVKSFQ